MKPALLLIATIATLGSGCASLNVDKLLPEGSAESAEIKAAGPFGATNLTVVNFVKTETEVTADSIDAVIHSPVQPVIEVRLKGYRRFRR